MGTAVDRSCGRCIAATVTPQAIVEELEWTDDVTTALNHPTSAALLPWMCKQVRSGVAQLFRIRDARDCLYIVTRVDRDPTEWAICYARGSGVAKFGPLIIGVAQQRGMPLRAHVDAFLQPSDPARVRLFRRLGFELSEYVLRCSHGQQRQGEQCESKRVQLDQYNNVQR